MLRTASFNSKFTGSYKRKVYTCKIVTVSVNCGILKLSGFLFHSLPIEPLNRTMNRIGKSQLH